jgi:hypothetical protein
MARWAKSGWPVTGQTEVNTGAAKRFRLKGGDLQAASISLLEICGAVLVAERRLCYLAVKLFITISPFSITGTSTSLEPGPNS